MKFPPDSEVRCAIHLHEHKLVEGERSRQHNGVTAKCALPLGYVTLEEIKYALRRAALLWAGKEARVLSIIKQKPADMPSKIVIPRKRSVNPDPMGGFNIPVTEESRQNCRRFRGILLKESTSDA